MVISFDRLLNWLASYGIRRYHEIHCSGYCQKKDLKRIVEEVNPEILIPVHTEHPELVERIGSRDHRGCKDTRFPSANTETATPS